PANQAAFWCMSRKREKEKVTIRVPNPNAPVKERLKTPSHKVHRSKRAYRRRDKHPKAPGLDEISRIMSAVADDNRGDFTANPRVLGVTLKPLIAAVARSFAALAPTTLTASLTNRFC